MGTEGLIFRLRTFEYMAVSVFASGDSPITSESSSVVAGGPGARRPVSPKKGVGEVPSREAYSSVSSKHLDS